LRGPPPPPQKGIRSYGGGRDPYDSRDDGGATVSDVAKDLRKLGSDVASVVTRTAKGVFSAARDLVSEVVGSKDESVVERLKRPLDVESPRPPDVDRALRGMLGPVLGRMVGPLVSSGIKQFQNMQAASDRCRRDACAQVKASPDVARRLGGTSLECGPIQSTSTMQTYVNGIRREETRVEFPVSSPSTGRVALVSATSSNGALSRILVTYGDGSRTSVSVPTEGDYIDVEAEEVRTTRRSARRE
jgi:hypothetical protein